MPFGLSASEVSPGSAPETAPGVQSGVPDPALIARMANALFQLAPNQTAASPNVSSADPGVPVKSSAISMTKKIWPGHSPTW